MNVRKARKEDIEILNEIYENARHFMHTHGNPNQWNDGSPTKTDLLTDIDENTLYVLEEDGMIQASFKYYEGIDPTYVYIVHGNWLNDLPYGVIHRVASRALKKGMGDEIIKACKSWKNNLKIDTHPDNKYMQALLSRNDFIQVGQIYLENGDMRLAYQFCPVDLRQNYR